MNEVILEKFFGKKICERQITIEGLTTPIPFSIYDGYAHGECQGHNYDMEYPQMEAVKNCEEIANAVIDYCSTIPIPNKPKQIEDITVIHVMATYNTLYQDGREWFND